LMITMLLRACRHTMIANAARFAYMVFAMPRGGEEAPVLTSTSA